jgi:hypothetical protein
LELFSGLDCLILRNAAELESFPCVAGSGRKTRRIKQNQEQLLGNISQAVKIMQAGERLASVI